MMIEVYGFCKVNNSGIMPVSQNRRFGDTSDDIPDLKAFAISKCLCKKMPITIFHIPVDEPGLVAGHLIERIQFPVFAYKLVRQGPLLLCERFQDPL
jgi:hypothetical protein